MGKTPLQRIAFVKFTTQGKSYAMKCDRDDLVVGDEVEVLMYTGSTKAYYHSGEITSVSHQRWNCSCHVLNHVCEVNITFDNSGLVRTTDYSNETKKKIQEWRAERDNYSNVVDNSEMRDIYLSVTPEIGEDAYLSDGLWITPDGAVEDRGK